MSALAADSGAGAGPSVVIGIDIGGTGSRFVAFDPTTHLVLARTARPTPAEGSPAEVLSFLRSQIERVAKGRRPAAIGIGASGPIDRDGIIQNPDTLAAFTGWPLIDGIADLTDGSIVIDNDAVCAALAEQLLGAARESPRSLHVTLGTGIGVCLLDGDRPFRNADGTHPEGGHMAVGMATPPCYCGRPACWEQAASRRTLQRSAAELLGRAASDAAVIDDAADLARRGDNDARDLFATYGRAVADGLATLVTLYGPNMVVLGGSAAAYLPYYQDAIQSTMAQLGRWVPTVNIVATELNDYGGAIGGARCATLAGLPNTGSLLTVGHES